MGQTVYRHAGVKLSGIEKLKNKHKGATAVICCSGTSLENYDDTIAPRDWIRIAVNEGIRKLQTANFWVLADDPIVIEYAKMCPLETTILCMHQATRIIHRHCKFHNVHTVESRNKARDYDNGFEFFSRGTVMIGAIEMARYMGVERFFIFGLDCYRKRDKYYYDGRIPHPLSEKHYNDSARVLSAGSERIFVTPRLKRMIEKLREVDASGIWSGIELHCVGSPLSQQTTIPLMSIESFKSLCEQHEKIRAAQEEEEKKRKKRPRKTKEQASLIDDPVLDEPDNPPSEEEQADGVQQGSDTPV